MTLKIIIIAFIVSVCCCACFCICKPAFKDKVDKVKDFVHQKTAQ